MVYSRLKHIIKLLHDELIRILGQKKEIKLDELADEAGQQMTQIQQLNPDMGLYGLAQLAKKNGLPSLTRVEPVPKPCKYSCRAPSL